MKIVLQCEELNRWGGRTRTAERLILGTCSQEDEEDDDEENEVDERKRCEQ